eukprot:TRINITY_DN121505_c0_g1_i1.p1 TRINITY_DN121505_c0_g1~~TRINITY_DN121505_c0_g1_i1.p1  ORF type:complete len:607 (+),score=191.51 TRINITY_DN121505_c0_g1_i1:101-1921(+)
MAPAEGAEAEGEVPKEEEEGEQGPTAPTHEPFSLGIFALIAGKQAINGLRHNDHLRYRHYCSRRLRHLYVKLKLKHGRGKYKEAALPDDFQDKRFLEIPLMQAERAWAYAVQVKSDNATAVQWRRSQKVFGAHRMRRAKDFSNRLEALMKIHCDARSQLEAEAYSAFMTGNWWLDREKWEKALEHLQKCKKTLEHLVLATSSEETLQALKNKLEEIAPLIREARYNMGMMFHDEEEEGSTFKGKTANKDLSGFNYRGHGLAIPSDKLKSKLVQCIDLFQGMKEPAEEQSNAQIIDSYGAVSVEFNDTLKDIHNDMIAAGADGHSDEWRMLEAFARELRICVNAERDLKLLGNHFEKFDALGAVKLSTVDGRKNSRPDEGMRFCELLKDSIEGLKELPDSTDVVKTVLSAYVQIVMNCRCFLLAMCHLAMSKPLEAAALLDMLHGRVDDVVLNQALHDPLSRLHSYFTKLHESLPSRVSKWRCRVLAQLCEEDLQKTKKATQVTPKLAAPGGGGEATKKTLRTAQTEALKEMAAGIGFPPKFQDIPCKPLLFDLAYQSIEPPNFDGKSTAKKAPAAPAASEEKKGSIVGRVASGVGSRLGSLFGGRK